MGTLIVELADLIPWFTLNDVVELKNYMVDDIW